MKTITLCLFCLISLSSFGQKFTEINGKLQLKGNQLCNEKGNPIQLKGFSTYNISFCPECVTYESLKSNRDFWGANLVRAAVYVDDQDWNKQTYHKNPAFSKSLVDSIVLWSEKLGMYCIIDWHILTKGNPNDRAHIGVEDFFKEMSSKYAKKNHVLYEICNEPNGEDVTWDVIAEYANRILPIIRNNSPSSIIIVGTPQWCQSLEKVDPSKIYNTTNIMYAFHFYAASHLGLLSVLEKEMHRIPLFVSEWGVTEYTGNGNVNFENSEKFLKTMKNHVKQDESISLSWCFFSYADIKEAASVLKPGSCKLNLWNNMTPTGFFIRDHIK